MLTKSNKQSSGFSVIGTEELFSINGGNGNATKYTYPDGTYMIVSNDGSFDTKVFNPDGSEKKMDGMCADTKDAIPTDVNYNPDTGTVTNALSDSASNTNVSQGGSGSSGGKA